MFVASPEHLKTIRPPILSWGATNGFSSAFIWLGTMDYTPYLTMWAALRILNLLGGPEKTSLRNANILRFATDELLAAGCVCSSLSESTCNISMACLQVAPSIELWASEHKISLHDVLLEQFGIEIPVFSFRGHQWVRVSAHVYNDSTDFCALRDALQDLLQRSSAVSPSGRI